jgi:SAM-dependent methyltransferase
MDIRSYNRDAWDREVEGKANPWTQAVDPAVIARARQGDWSVLLTESLSVPRAWFPALEGAEILCLASGGGQQGPILAAAGANVTVFDNSPAQLAQDRLVVERESLDMRLVEGDAADLSFFSDACFDVVFNPVSTVFMPDVRPVWKEAARVLRPGGILMTGNMNPVSYMFDFAKLDAGILQVAHSIPYSDVKDLSPRELEAIMQQGYPLEFGHSLTNLLGGQLDAGLVITALYEDYKSNSPLSDFHPSYIATRAVKPPVPLG